MLGTKKSKQKVTNNNLIPDLAVELTVKENYKLGPKFFLKMQLNSS